MTRERAVAQGNLEQVMDCQHQVPDRNALLARQLAMACKHSAYYRRLLSDGGIDAADIHTLADIGKLPVMDANLFLNIPEALIPPAREVVRYCQTSGSTGEPKLVPYTRTDIDNAVMAQASCFLLSGVEQYHRGLCAMAYGPWASGLICQAAGELFGLTVPAEATLGIDYQLWAIRHYRPDYMVCFPSFLPRLEQTCAAQGIDPESLGIKTIFMAGEIFSGNFRRHYQSLFGSALVNMYANTEFGLMAFECRHGRLHFLGNFFHVEVLCPHTGVRCKYGETGELVITALQRQALPLIRYNTRDLAREYGDPCECGRPGQCISPIEGRSDNMFTYAGAIIYPSTIDDAVTAVEGLSSIYRCTVDRVQHRDRLYFQIEAGYRVSDEKKAAMRKALLTSLAEADPVFKRFVMECTDASDRLQISIVQPGVLSREGGKVHKIIDLRSG